MLEVTSNSQLAMSDQILIQGIPELNHFYAFNVKDGDHFKLNHTAYWVLETIGRGLRFEDLISRYMEKYEIGRDIAEKDSNELIRFALKSNIIKEVSDEKEKGLTKL